MMRPKSVFHLSCLLILIFLSACSNTKSDPETTLPEAHQKFLRLCREEYKLDVVIKPLAHTVWIYVPLKENLMVISAAKTPPLKSNQPATKPAVRFIDASFKDGTFLVEYDIAAQKAYPNTPGYKFEYTQSYQKVNQRILTAVARSFFDAKKDGESASSPALNFFVITIADITGGIEITNTFYLDDLKRYMAMESIPQEEYMQRNLFEVKGNAASIGDIDGRHLDYREITMPEFLAKQMVQRVNFKYQQSSFPPSGDTRTEILQIAAHTLRYYDFTDFASLRLRDLSADSTETIPKSDLTDYTREETEREGRLIHIRFQ